MLQLKKYNPKNSLILFFQCMRSVSKANSGDPYANVYPSPDESNNTTPILPKSKYGGINYITLLTGQSIIGKQGAKYVTSLMQGARVPISIHKLGVDQEDEYFKSVMRNHAAVHVDIVHDGPEKRKTLKMSKALDLFIFMVRLRTFPGFNCRFRDVDIQIIAENCRGNFSELEYRPVPGVIEGLRVVTEKQSEQLISFAFDHMRKSGRKRVTLVHKHREWPLTDGILVNIAKKLQKTKYSDIQLELMGLSKCVNQLVMNPNHFDVIISNERYGTFLASVCSGVCGGANLFSSIERGDKYAVFKPLQTRLSLTNYKVLSPYGIVSTCVDMLNYLGHHHCAKSLWKEMLRTMKEGTKTAEFGGVDSGDYVICNIMNQLCCSLPEDHKKCE